MSSDEDILGELVKTVKELSEKNYSLTLKVNELEMKIAQVELNKSDISTLKSNNDAANTDRTAIKDLLNLKVTETKNTFDEKINSFKKDFSYVKEDMNSISSQNSDLKTQLAKLSTEVHNSLKVLSEETVKNFETVKTDLSAKFQSNAELISNLTTAKDQLEKNFQNNLESITNTFQDKINALSNQLTSFTTELTTKLQDSESIINQKFDQAITNLTSELTTQTNSNAEQFEKIASETAMELNRVTEETDSKLQQLNDQNEGKLNQLSEQVEEKLQTLQGEISTKFENHQGIVSNLSSQTDLTFNNVNKKLNNFFDVSNNHGQVLKVFEEIIGQIQANIEQANLEVKNSQELLLESFQKIIVGQAENLRNELLTFSKEIRTNLSKFNDDVASRFTPIDETTKVNDKIKSLDTDLHTRSENIRKQLIETLEENVQKFDASIKDSISSVDEYRVDLERFKDDIESLIERKVNEKTEFSMELFNNLLTKAEYISKLIHDSRVTKVPDISIPIPEIKNPESLDES